MSLKIYGAGMAGLLSAHILRRHNPVIHEVQSSLPNNHTALLRFRSNDVSEATGIPFKKVKVQKGIWDHRSNILLDRAPLDLSNMYSLKVIGTIHGRSILNLEPVERYIAPEDFISRLAEGLYIHFNSPLIHLDSGGPAIVSTIPMPTLMKLVGLDMTEHEFKAKRIWIYTVYINSPKIDVYQTVYFAHPTDWLYRVSITGNRVTFEYTEKPTETKTSYETVSNILEEVFGISASDGIEFIPGSLTTQRFGKILPIDDDARRAFILYATEHWGIFSIGRFATWRQILLDDIVKDCNWVDTMLKQRDRYAGRFLTANR